ncbi:MAG TPA: trehalose-phosphatase [Kofleriaceae bacterium]|nr:trehalose-phosphatase [Kofleriaceae bacterium]
MTVSSASPVLADVRWQNLAKSSALALLVDLDGTLIEFAPTLEQAALTDEVVTLLRRLAATGVQVVIVSGRPSWSIDVLRPRIPEAWWVAEHGSWRWSGDFCFRPEDRSLELEALTDRLFALFHTPGIRIERKARSLCVHWRSVDPGRRDELIALVEAVCDEWIEEHPAFERLAGVEMTEVRHHSAHKGSAVRWIRRVLPDASIIAMGDDVTDEDMFAELAEGDASVRVGSAEGAAHARAADVRAAIAFVSWIADVRSGRNAAMPITPSSTRTERRRHPLVVISNRTPALTQGRTRGVGGLVSALEPALRDQMGVWLGWSGQEREHDERVVIDDTEYPVRARFDLPPAVRQQYYAGFCNQVLWPLFHGFPSRVKSSDGDWAAYVAANERFAHHAIELAQRHATIWVHDYHLLLVGQALRRLGHHGPVGLFLHIPFPSPEVLSTLPWARNLVDAILDFAIVGFQTTGDLANFRTAARGLCPERTIPELEVFPATIDPEVFRSVGPDVREVAGLRSALGDRRLILGVDRLDYSKGIPQRLDAYERLLDHYPEWRRRVSFLQISVPSRAEIPDYAELREQVERMVGRINGRFGDTDWVPVRYLYRSYDHHVLAQLYRLADIGLVTPLRDGMNLVAKEFVSAQPPDHPGVLILSKFAGAAETMTSAVVTNPLHPEGLAADLDLALRMPQDERLRRHRHLLAALEREGDARVWARRFLDRLVNARPHPL